MYAVNFTNETGVCNGRHQKAAAAGPAKWHRPPTVTPEGTRLHGTVHEEADDGGGRGTGGSPHASPPPPRWSCGEEGDVPRRLQRRCNRRKHTAVAAGPAKRHRPPTAALEGTRPHVASHEGADGGGGSPSVPTPPLPPSPLKRAAAK